MSTFEGSSLSIDSSSGAFDQVAEDSTHQRSDGPANIADATTTQATQEKAAVARGLVSWNTLPKKGQLAILAAARITELISERSHATYVFYQMRSFALAGHVSDSQIVSQAGILMASWAAAQCLMAMWWGRVANSPRVGRKRVLLIGLAGTAIASLGTGFSKNFTQILILKLVAGGLNANLGIMRTMIGEGIEHRFQNRAFLLLPMCLNIGELLGPLLGGFLTDPYTLIDGNPATSTQSGRSEDFTWTVKFPYALPNLICALLIGISAIMVIFALDETHQALRGEQDQGRKICKWIYKRLQKRRQTKHRYQQLPGADNTELAPMYAGAAGSNLCHIGNRRLSTDPTGSSIALVTAEPEMPPHSHSGLPEILTWRVVLILLTHHILMLHFSAFNTIIGSFLSAPRSAASQPRKLSGLHFTGGVGLSPSQVGIALALLGLIGLLLQLLVYPTVTARIGSLKSYRLFLLSSALSYILLPFLTLLPENPWILWPGLVSVLAFQALSRTFALPSTIKLVNNCSPFPSLRSTIHGLALSIGSAARILGPIGSSWVLGLGLKRSMVGVVWWCMTGIVVLNCILLSVLQSIDSQARTPSTN